MTTTFALSNAPQMPAVAGNLSGYLDFVNSIPRLTEEEERGLALRVQLDKDKDAARRLALSNLRLVVAVAANYRGYGLEQTDLIQEGNIGLLKAIRKYDPARGARLATFAMYWIKAEIYEFIVRNWRIVKIATTKAQRKLFFNMRKINAAADPMQTEITDASVARELDVAPEDVREMRRRMHGSNTVALAADEDNPGAEAVLADDAADAETMLEERDKRRRLAAALERLNEREQNIIAARFADPPVTLQSLAKKHNISLERVRQIETATIKKISQWAGA